MTTPTLNQRMLAPKNAPQSTLAHGVRSYSVSASGFVDVPAHDAVALEAQGWVAMPRGLGVGPSTARPGPNAVVGLAPAKGDAFLDTTLGITIVYDGAQWRNPISGAVA